MTVVAPVGAGTFGSVLAHELSSYSDNKILLIEAGGQYGYFASIPLICTLMQGSVVDWAFKTTSQKFSSHGLYDNVQFWPRGKGLGGSGQINYMLHFSGNENDFNEWETLGANDWNYKNLECYFDKLFNRNMRNCIKEIFNSVKELPGVQKAVHTTKLNTDESKLGINFKQAEMDLNKIRNENEKVQFNLAEYTTKNGKRWSSFHEYLLPSLTRPNLHIMMNTIVRRVVFDDKKVIGVEIKEKKNKLKIVKARKEVILSAGAIQSPHLLKLSGIGPKEELDQFGIDVIHNSRNVGSNLFDHLNMPIFVSINQSMSVTKDKILSLKQLFKYVLYGRGIFGNAGIIGTGKLINSSHGIIIFGVGSVDEAALKSISNYKSDTFQSLFPFHYNSSQEGFVLLSTCYHPKSRGTIKLKNNKIESHPEINPNYLANIDDVSCMIKGIRLAIETIMTEAFRNIGATIHWPKLKQCLQFGPFPKDFITNKPSDEYLECIMRIVAVPGHHPGGTCAIGDDKSVVDNKLRVRGVTGLRVVDGSVIPSPLSGFPNSIFIAMAERAAHIILHDLGIF